MIAMPAEVPSGGSFTESPRDTLVHADALYHLARHLTGNASDAEDLVQETYSRALEAWGRLEPGSNVRAWLFRILRNAFISRRRHEGRWPAPDPYDTTESSPQAAGADDGWLRGDVELERMRQLVGAEIEAALRTLSADARMVILLDVDGFTEAEIAVVMACAVGTVKSRLARARAALRLKLAEYGREVGS